MTSTHGKWLRSLLAGMGLLVSPVGASSLWAQGFGPDPFKPYNSQYIPYTYPTGPASPEAGQGGPVFRSGNRGANQFQNYLDEIQGAGRQGTERYGIGLPYYRSTVDPSVVDPEGKRDYRPNRRVDRTYEQTQEVVTRKYLAYFSEKDPKKRAALLRDYNQMRGNVARALSARREDPTRGLEAATRLGSETRLAPLSTGRAGRLPAASTSGSRGLPAEDGSRAGATESLRSGGSRAVPPAPPLFPGSSSRTTRSRRTPSEILNRARRRNSLDDDASLPGAGDADAGARGRGNRRSTTAPPPLN